MEKKRSILFLSFWLLTGLTPLHAHERSRAKNTRPKAADNKPRILAKGNYTKFFTRPKLQQKIKRLSNLESKQLAEKAVFDHLAEKISTEGPESTRVSLDTARSKSRAVWEIRQTKIISNPDPSNHPITGNATVVVILRQRSLIKKAGRKDNYVVNIGTDGKAEVLGKSNGSKAIIALRSANEKMALGSFIKEAYKTKGFKSRLAITIATGVTYGMGKIGTYELTKSFLDNLPLVVVLAGMYSLESLKTGKTNRDAAREVVFNDLTSKFMAKLETGKTIPLSLAYEQYKDKFLKPIKLGSKNVEKVSPLSREEFVLSLYLWESEHFPVEEDK